MSGWLKLHRQLQDNPLWLSEPFSRGQAWVDLMMLANHKDGFIRVRGHRIAVKKGVVARSKDKLGERWQWSRGKVLRFIKELENDGQISQKTVHSFTLITLCNYTTYQSRGEPRGTPDDTANGTPDGRQTVQQTVHQTVHIQEGKEGKEGKEEEEEVGHGSVFLKRLAEFHGYSELALRRNIKNIEQAQIWADENLTVGELDRAVEQSRKSLQAKGDTSNPPLRYLASVICNLGSVPPKSTHSGFDERDYHNDPAAAKFKKSGASS